jgi:TonB family protein
VRQNGVKEAPVIVRNIVVATAFAVTAAVGLSAQDPATYEIGRGVLAPSLVREVKPKYTESAMRRKVQGTVELSAVVLANGTVGEDVKITRSLDSDLDEQAISAARQWEFKPGTKNGEPVNVRVSIEMSFSLRDKK